VFIPGRAEAAGALIDAHQADGTPLPHQNGTIDLSAVGPAGTFRYRVDLRRAVSSLSPGHWTSDYCISTAGAWLWRPARMSSQTQALIIFDGPEGLHPLTPWPRLAQGWYQLRPSAFRTASFVAFTRNSPVRTRVGSSEITLGLLGPGWSLNVESQRALLGSLAHRLASVTGAFPARRLLLLMLPSSREGVHFGMVRRGGGASIAYIAGQSTTLPAFLQSWVLWHEVSHLLLPSLPAEDAWFYEGFATYYQEVLRSRGGTIAPEAAYGSLVNGAARVAQTWRSRRTLAEESEAMQRTRNYSLVYRLGAALILGLDSLMHHHGASLDATLGANLLSTGEPQPASSASALCRRWTESFSSQTLREFCESMPRVTAASAEGMIDFIDEQATRGTEAPRESILRPTSEQER